MSDTVISLDIDKIEDKQSNNEKKETNINIDEDNEQDKKNNEINNGAEVNYTVENEIQDILQNANRIEQQCAVFEMVGNQRKPPDVWVQYNQEYGGQGKRRAALPQFGGETGGGGGGGFDYDPQTRNYFVKYVFSILLVMLLVTFAFNFIVLATPDLKKHYRHTGMLHVALSSLVLLAMSYVMSCCACARVPPCNFFSLLIVVAASSDLASAITVRYKTHVIVYALMATCVVVFVCVILAMSSFDFTKFYIYFVVASVVFVCLCVALLVAMLLLHIRYKPLHIAIMFGAALFNSVAIIMELQMILGGGAIEIGEEDYALGAYMLYTSIIHLFLDLVQLIGLIDSD